MKTKSLFILSLLLAFSLVSSAQKTNSETEAAIAFNDYCASISDSLYILGVDWGSKFNSIQKTKKFEALTPLRENLTTFIARKQKELRSKKVPADMETYKNCMVSYLSVELEMIEGAFIPMENLNKNSSDEEVDAKTHQLVTLSEKETEALNIVRREQEKVAKIYKFAVVDTE